MCVIGMTPLIMRCPTYVADLLNVGQDDDEWHEWQVDQRGDRPHQPAGYGPFFRTDGRRIPAEAGAVRRLRVDILPGDIITRPSFKVAICDLKTFTTVSDGSIAC
jgi:hypothetical protein